MALLYYTCRIAIFRPIITMKRLLLFLIFFLSVSAIFAQQKMDTIAFYMSKSGVVIKKDSAIFIRFLIFPDGSGVGEKAVFADLYMNGKPKMAGWTTARNAYVELALQDTCTEFYENGNIKSQKLYDHSNVIGDEYNYFPNGRLYNVITHTRNGTLYNVCHDTSGNYTANNGNGKWITYDKNFKAVLEEGAIAAGDKDGEWKFNDKGQIKTAVFKSGQFVSGDPEFSDVNRIYSNTDEPAQFNGGINGFYTFIAHYMRYPAKARERDIQGKVILQFIVEKDGSLTNFKTLSSPDESLTTEAMRVMKTCPNFLPAKVRGVPVRSLYTMPLSFTMQEEH